MALTVAFEGIPGSGKTTVIQILARELSRRGFKTEIVDTDNIEYASLFHSMARSYPLGHPARTILYWMLRVQQHDTVKKLSDKVDIILADRFWNSTFAFDVCGNKVPLQVWEWVSDHVTYHPDITFLFEITLEAARKRKVKDIMSDLNFAHRVQSGYAMLADRLLWMRINAACDLAEVTNKCLEVILSRF